LIRFNGTTGNLQQDLNVCIGQTFTCTEPVFALGGNRVVFGQKAQDKRNSPDYFLVVITADRFGSVQFESPNWKSDGAMVLAVSRLREKQETMLLMRLGDWIETNVGWWYLTEVPQLKTGAALQLAER
jgi:hypothetical protein